MIAKMRKKETNEQTKSSEEVIDECRNPYLKFLNNLVDDETPELISSLQSWLGFAGSMTGAGGNIITKSKKKTPWKKEEEKKLDETMAKKAEATMHKISSEFCRWVRNLPGEDISVNEISEDTISALFDTGISANPGTSVIGEGLKSWAKFGSSVTGTEKAKKEFKPPFVAGQRSGKLNDKKYVDKLLNGTVSLKSISKNAKSSKYDLSAHQIRKCYGAWYQDPSKWNDYLNSQKENNPRSANDYCNDKWSVSNENLRAELPGQVNMMGGQQPVAQLHSTRAFDKYLTDLESYDKPAFLIHIFKSID